MKIITLPKSIVRSLALWGLLVISLVVLIRLAPQLARPQYFRSDDFMPYWAGGKLNLSGENPYDAQKKEQVQIEAGGQPSNQVPIAIFLNPPWTLPFVMPFSLISYSISRIAWLLFSITCLVISAIYLWRYYDGPPKVGWLAWVVVIIFAPTISMLEDGQIAFLILLGLVGFLYFSISHENDWAGGAALALVSIKPQVIYLFWIAILFWVIKQRRWKVLVSCFLTIVALTALAMLFNPRVISQYLAMMQNSYLAKLATPTIGAYLRFFWLGVDKFWLQFVPPFVGGLWFIYYWLKNRNVWSWSLSLPILLLVSQVTAPYTYTYDQVVLLPAIILAVLWLYKDRKRWSSIVMAILLIIICILDLILHMKLNDFWFVWMAPALLAWYLVAQSLGQKEHNLASIPELESNDT